MKVDCTIIAQDWDGRIPALNVGKFDVIKARMLITDKRLEVMDFSWSYAVDQWGFAVAKESEYGKLGPSEKKFSLNDEAWALARSTRCGPC